MRKTVFLTLVTWILLLNNSHAQECMHTNLSHHFNYQISVSRTLDKDSVLTNAKIVLRIYDKHSKKLVQKIDVENSNSIYDAFKDCTKVRSYITGYRKNAEADDCDYGDLIVADLNFDGREDFVINGGYSADAGPNYIFYFQDKPGHFKLSHFLSDRMASFPTYIDAKQKTLVQVYVLGRHQYTKTFKYNVHTRKWRLAKWTEKKVL